MHKYNFNVVEWEYILKRITKEIINLGGSYVDMDELYGSAVVKYEMDGTNKFYYFDIGNYKRTSNIFDGIYGGQNFLKSYLINGKVRVFVGKLDYKTHKVLPICFDINKQKYSRFIINKDGFIDETEMVKLLEKETIVKGFEQEFYNEVGKGNLLEAMYDLGVKKIPTPIIMLGLNDQNIAEKESVYKK